LSCTASGHETQRSILTTPEPARGILSSRLSVLDNTTSVQCFQNNYQLVTMKQVLVGLIIRSCLVMSCHLVHYVILTQNTVSSASSKSNSQK